MYNHIDIKYAGNVSLTLLGPLSELSYNRIYRVYSIYRHTYIQHK